MQHAQSFDFAPNNERHIDTFYYVTDSRLLFPRQQISSECVYLARSFVATWSCLFLRTAGTWKFLFGLSRRRLKSERDKKIISKYFVRMLKYDKRF